MVAEPLCIRPSHLLCLVCQADQQTARVLAEIRADPSLPLRLVCGEHLSLAEEKRDLDVLQRLGLVPGDIRPALDLFERLFQRIPDAAPICAPGHSRSSAWEGCPRAPSGAYAAVVARGVSALLSLRSAAAKAQAKAASVAAIRTASELAIRPHHLLCLTCFHRGREAAAIAPIQEDNLAEVIQAMQANPAIPVRLVRGCCMVCPPCSRYEPRTNCCLGGNSMALRDQKKDLDVLYALGLEFGAVLPARDLLRQLYAAIRSTTQICGYGDGVARSPEWGVCGGPEGHPGYPLGRAKGLGVPGAMPDRE